MTTRPSFTEADTERLVALLNFVANNAEFNKLSVKKVLEFTKLLNWAQTELLPKLEAHRFEVLSVTQVSPEEPPQARTSSKKK